MNNKGFKTFEPCGDCSPRTFNNMGTLKKVDFGAAVDEVRDKITSNIPGLKEQISPTDEQLAIIGGITEKFDVGELYGHVWHCARQQSLGNCALVKVIS